VLSCARTIVSALPVLLEQYAISSVSGAHAEGVTNIDIWKFDAGNTVPSVTVSVSPAISSCVATVVRALFFGVLNVVAIVHPLYDGYVYRTLIFLCVFVFNAS